MNTLVSILAAAPNQPAGILSNPLFMMVPMMVIFYFLLIRPQQKQRKAHQARLSALQVGDKVVTTAGLHGKVDQIKDATVLIRASESIVLEFDKAAIATVLK